MELRYALALANSTEVQLMDTSVRDDLLTHFKGSNVVEPTTDQWAALLPTIFGEEVELMQETGAFTPFHQVMNAPFGLGSQPNRSCARGVATWRYSISPHTSTWLLNNWLYANRYWRYSERPITEQSEGDDEPMQREALLAVMLLGSPQWIKIDIVSSITDWPTCSELAAETVSFSLLTLGAGSDLAQIFSTYPDLPVRLLRERLHHIKYVATEWQKKATILHRLARETKAGYLRVGGK